MKKVCTRVIVVLRDRGSDLDGLVKGWMLWMLSCSEKNHFGGIYLGGCCCDVKNKN